MAAARTVAPRGLAAAVGRMVPALGLAAALALMAAAMIVPAAAGWDVHVMSFPPLHAEWAPRTGPGTLPALALAILAALFAIDAAERLPWRWLLGAVFAAGLAWMLALALVGGADGIGRILETPYEYLRTARKVHDVGGLLQEWVGRIPYDSAPKPNWPVHVAGHPPGALLVFVGLDRIGLGGGLAAGLVVTLLAATTAVAVLVCVRVLGDEGMARRAAPFLVFAPAAVWQAVSADAMFAAVAAWGLAALAVAATRRSAGWAAVAGLLLGACVMLSYGLPLLGILALTVLALARSWRALPIATVAALAVVGAFAALGFSYPDALAALHQRYLDGVGGRRPWSYWSWGSLAALLFSAGPLAAAGLTRVRTLQPVAALAAAAAASVLVADATQMSKAEVERIWLPFVPWILLSCALLSDRWRRAGLVLQLAIALSVEHLLSTGW
jgi:methylthioxylose transferase